MFICKNICDYDFYDESDLLLLTDVFEAYRKTFLSQYRLNPVHHYSSPGLSLDALPRDAKIELELLISYDQHWFAEKD